MLLFPNTVGFHFGIDFRIWQFISVLFLLPLLVILKSKIMFHNIDFIVISLIIISSVSSFFFFGIQSGIGFIIKGSLYYIFPFIVAKHLIENEEQILGLFKVITVCAIMLALIALYEYFTKTGYLENSKLLIDPDEYGTSRIYERYGDNLIRVMASFGHPIYLGVFMIMVALINASFLINPRKNYLRPVVLLLQIILAGIAVLISQSRTAAVALIIIIPFYYGIVYKKTSSIKLMLYMLPIGLMTFYLIDNYFYDYYNQTLNKQVFASNSTNTFEFRLQNLAYGIEIFSKNINWIGENNRYLTGKWLLENKELSNGFVNRMTTFGFLYFIIYVYLWFYSIINFYKRSANFYFMILTLILIFLFIVNNITELNFQNEILFFIIIGLGFNESLQNKYEQIG